MVYDIVLQIFGQSNSLKPHQLIGDNGLSFYPMSIWLNISLKFETTSSNIHIDILWGFPGTYPQGILKFSSILVLKPMVTWDLGYHHFNSLLLNMVIYSGFTQWKWWLSIDFPYTLTSRISSQGSHRSCRVSCDVTIYRCPKWHPAGTKMAEAKKNVWPWNAMDQGASGA